MFSIAAIPPESQLQGALLICSIVALGLVGIGIIVGLIIARRRHWRRLQEKPLPKTQSNAVDPWEESARRMAVPQPEEVSEANDDANEDENFNRP